MSRPLDEPAQYHSFRWFVLVTLFVVTCATAGLGLISPAPLIGAILSTPGQTLTAGEVTWMTMGWFNFALACAALVGGYLIDRFGFTSVFVAGSFLVGLGWLLVPSLGDTYGGMMLIRTLQGFGAGPILGSAAAVAAVRFPLKERAIVTGAQGAGVSAGIGIGQVLMPKILAANGGDWQAALASLWPVAALSIVLSVIVWFGPKQVPVEPVAVTDEEKSEIKHALTRALALPATWIAIGCVVAQSWANQAYNDLSPTYLSAEPPLGIGLPNGSALIGYTQVFFVLGGFVVGAVTERVFRGRVRPALTIGFGFGAVFALGMLFPPATTSSGRMLVVLVGVSFFFAWVNPTIMAFFAKTYPSKITGRLGGLTMGIGVFGGTAGVAAGSGALHATGRYVVSIIIMAAVLLVGLVVAQMLRRPERDRAVADADEHEVQLGPS